MTSNQTLLVLGGSHGLHLPPSRSAHSTIIVVTHGGTKVVANEEIFLIISASEEVEHAGVGAVADSLQDHVVSLLDGDEANVLHSLHEGECATVGLAGLVVQVLTQSMLVVKVVPGPELH